MASIEKRERDGHTSYRVRYRDPSGRSRNKTFQRMVDARRFASSVEVSKDRAEWVDPQLGRRRYRDWHAEWWATTTNLRASTRAQNESYIRNHVLPVFGDLPLAAIGQLDVRRWVADLSASGLAPSTMRKVYAIFGKTMRAAVDAGLIAKTPCRAIPLPKAEHSEMRFLTPLEVARLADTIDERYRALVLVAAYGGLRIGELAALRRERVDLLRGTVEVAEVLTEVSGNLHVGPPKTRASRRTVTLPRAVVDELAEHLERYASPDGWVFPAPQGGPLRVPGFRQRQWIPAVRASGLEPLRLHDLRHTAVALWIASGADPKQIAVRAGHTSVSFTFDRYGHLMPDHDLELRDRLDAMFTAGERAHDELGEVVPLKR